MKLRGHLLDVNINPHVFESVYPFELRILGEVSLDMFPGGCYGHQEVCLTILYQLLCLIAACAAASLAIGTRKGEHET